MEHSKINEIHDHHNQAILKYYDKPELKHRMHPHQSHYLLNHISRLIEVLKIQPGERVCHLQNSTLHNLPSALCVLL